MLFTVLVAIYIGTHNLPDMYALGLQAYTSGKSLVPILQLVMSDNGNLKLIQ